MADSIETVGDLKAVLALLSDDTPVVLAQDPEGNGFGRLSDYTEQMVDPDEPRPEGVYLTPEDYAERIADPDSGYTEEDEAPKSCTQRALVLWPV